MTLILVEGLDRAGKTTRCRELMAEPRTRPRVMLHFVAPPRRSPGSDPSLQVLREIVFAYQLAEQNQHMDFVLDRGHVSWFAYDELLRGGHTYEGEVLRVEAVAGTVERRVEYVECRDALKLARRDDGHSTYTPSKNTSSLQVLRHTAENIVVETLVFDKVLSMTSWPVKRVVTG